MNLDEFKDPICYLCLARTVVASWSLTQEAAGQNKLFKKYYILSLNSVNTFRENSTRLLILKAFQLHPARILSC